MPNYDKLTENLTRRGYTVPALCRPPSRRRTIWTPSSTTHPWPSAAPSRWTSWICTPACPPTTASVALEGG